MLCFPAIFYHVGNPYACFSYGSLPVFLSSGKFTKCVTELWGNIKHGPCGSTACWVEPFTSERHAAGCGLHKVIAFGFWGIQECISTIINKSTLA